MRTSKLLVSKLTWDDSSTPISNGGNFMGNDKPTHLGLATLQTQSNATQFSVASRIQGDLASRGFIAYHPQLAKALGGYKPALMLGHALYWTEHWLATQPHRMGWFWKTAQDWQSVTGLSPYEQSKARATLVQFNVLEERLSGNPAKLHFKVNLAALSALLNFHEDGNGDLNWSQLTPLLGSRVMFFKPLVDVTQSVSGGLVLSHLLSEYRTALKNNQVLSSGFFYMKVESERHALGLPIKIHNRARSDLKSAGIIQVDYSQEQPPRLLVRVNTATVLACISGDHSSTRLKPKKRPISIFAEVKHEGQSNSTQLSSAHQLELLEPSLAQQHHEIMCLVSGTGSPGKLSSAARGGKSEQMGDTHVGMGQAEVNPANFATYIQQQDKAAASTKLASQLFPFCETGSSLSTKLDVPKVENWIAPFCETKSSLSAKLFIQIEVTNTTTAHEAKPVAVQDDWSRSSNFENAEASNSIATSLVFPDALDKRHHASALKVISRAPGPLQQGILDELDGALQSGKSIRNIAGWLNSVVEKANDGTLILGLADDIAEIRKGRERQVERERTLLKKTHTATQDTSGGVIVETPVVNPEAVKTARERLRQLGTEMRNKNIGISK
jgi:hypothetical protein